jgi:hypothetical protein
VLHPHPPPTLDLSPPPQALTACPPLQVLYPPTHIHPQNQLYCTMEARLTGGALWQRLFRRDVGLMLCELGLVGAAVAPATLRPASAPTIRSLSHASYPQLAAAHGQLIKAEARGKFWGRGIWAKSVERSLLAKTLSSIGWIHRLFRR